MQKYSFSKPRTDLRLLGHQGLWSTECLFDRCYFPSVYVSSPVEHSRPMPTVRRARTVSALYLSTNCPCVSRRILESTYAVSHCGCANNICNLIPLFSSPFARCDSSASGACVHPTTKVRDGVENACEIGYEGRQSCPLLSFICGHFHVC